jgi:hypothetical protein
MLQALEEGPDALIADCQARLHNERLALIRD